MTRLEQAVGDIASILEELEIRYMLIGGLAVAAWGEPRATFDVDWTVWIEPNDLDPTVNSLTNRLSPLVREPLEFCRRTRVLPVQTSSGVRADIILGALPYEREAIARAKTKVVGGKQVRVAALEDLIFSKLISEREKDLVDGRALLRRHREAIDRPLLEGLLKPVSESMGRDDILALLDATWG